MFYWDELKCTTFFNIDLQLTDKGYENWETVVEYVFAALKNLREHGIKEEIHTELHDRNRLKFDYMEKKQTSMYVTALASRMQKYPLQDVLRSQISPMEKYLPNKIKEAMDWLTLDNCKLILRSKKLKDKCTLKEDIYGQSYFIQEISPELKKACEMPLAPPSPNGLTLGLHPKNPFLPKMFVVGKPET